MIELRVLLQTLRRNVWLIAAITVLAGAMAAWLAYSAEPRYRAAAALRLLDERRMLTGGMDMGMAEAVMGRQADPLLSQIQVLRSRSVLGEVVDREGLRLAVVDAAVPRALLAELEIAPSARPDTLRVGFTEDAYTVSAQEGGATATYGEPVSVAGVSFVVEARPEDAGEAVFIIRDRDQSIDVLLEGLRVRPRDRTDIIDIEFESRDRELAQRVVNTTAQVFRQRSQQAAGEQSRRRREFVEARLVETEALMHQAQEALSAFQRREQVFSSQELFAAQQVSMHNLELRREELDAERRMFTGMRSALAQGRDRQREGLRTVVSAPGIADNPVVSQLYTQLVRYEITRDSLRAGGSSTTNPDWVRVNALIESTEDNLSAALDNHINALDARIAAVEELRRRRSAEITSMPSVQAEEARLVLEFETIRRMADQLREEAQRARISEVVEAGQVEIIDLAPLPGEPINDRKPFKLALGMMLGLMLGSGAALLRENMNTAVRTREDVETQLHATALAIVPKIQPLKGVERFRSVLQSGRKGGAAAVVHAGGNGAGTADAMVIVHAPQSAPAEAYRKLRTNLIFAQTERPIRNLVVTSSMAGEGKSTTSSNLAASYAQQGMSVLLVDADLRRPTQHYLFGMSKEPGLTDLVLERATVDDVIRRTELPSLSVVPAGLVPPNPSELVGGPRFRAAMARLSEGYDLVIVDTPPILAASEGAILGARADATILVVKAGVTHRDSARQALVQLRSVSANVVGVVLNDPEGKVPKYSSYDQYYYTYYGAEEKAGV